VRSHRRVRLGVALVCVACLEFNAGSSADDKLAHFIEYTKQQPGEPVEPLPEIKEYDWYKSNYSLRSPFMPSPNSGTLLGQRKRSSGTRSAC